MKLKPNVQYYEFHCGCRVKKSDLKAYRGRDGGPKKSRCNKHRRGVKHVCILCPDCGEKFFSGTAARVRCDYCQHEKLLEQARAYINRQYEKMKTDKLLPVCDSKKNHEKEEPIKETVDKTRRWECVHGDKCLNGEVFRNVEFNCYKCEKFEKVERHCDIYSKDNERYIYA